VLGSRHETKALSAHVAVDSRLLILPEGCFALQASRRNGESLSKLSSCRASRVGRTDA